MIRAGLLLRRAYFNNSSSSNHTHTGAYYDFERFKASGSFKRGEPCRGLSFRLRRLRRRHDEVGTMLKLARGRKP